ncbi:MAG TPA: winged helix-turn-helix transcriptional regulator [Solirubrobacterales bacterium]|nr:winged helix-turn-helix transcriptional regulator [Solirubrobacterales bacterium]
MRAGAYALSLLATPGVSSVLRALETEAMPLADLRRAVGSPPQTTMRVQLRELTALGVLARGRELSFPRSVSYELTEPGRELLAVAEILERWLADSEAGPLRLGEAQARRLVKALADGWEAGIAGLLAAEPRSLTQLSREISSLSYPSLERRLSAMRAAGLVETLESDARGAPCQPTAWLRRAAAPLAATSRFERAHVAGGQETKVDIQALLLLALPMVQLPQAANGAATLATRQPSPDGAEHRPAPEAVTVQIRDGLPRRCAAAVEEGVEAWVLGAPLAWLRAFLDGALESLRFGGPRPELAESVVSTLHSVLGGRMAPQATAPAVATAR